MEDLPLSRSGRAAREVAVAAARRAGEGVMAQFRKDKLLSYKGRGNPVTSVDLWAEESIVALLREEYPTHGFMAEEGHREGSGAAYTWVIDPLDGTLNYTAGLAYFCTSIALVKDLQPVLGLIYDPARDELFLAERGHGASLDGRPIACGAKTELGLALVGFDLGYDEEGRALALEIARAVRPQVQALRVMGSAALSLAYTACGRLDLYFHPFLYPWDIAAAQLLIAEAGGTICDWDGNPCTLHSRRILAANPGLHASLAPLLRQASNR